METVNRIEVIKSWIASCNTDEQLIKLRDFVTNEYKTIPEELRNAIEDQRIEIVKNEFFVLSVPTLERYIF